MSWDLTSLHFSSGVRPIPFIDRKEHNPKMLHVQFSQAKSISRNAFAFAILEGEKSKFILRFPILRSHLHSISIWRSCPNWPANFSLRAIFVLEIRLVQIPFAQVLLKGEGLLYVRSGHNSSAAACSQSTRRRSILLTPRPAIVLIPPYLTFQYFRGLGYRFFRSNLVQFRRLFNIESCKLRDILQPVLLAESDLQLTWNVRGIIFVNILGVWRYGKIILV